jgi:hypothetical protein
MTYEICPPRASESPRARWCSASIPASTLEDKLKELGYNLSKEDLEHVFVKL